MVRPAWAVLGSLLAALLALAGCGPSQPRLIVPIAGPLAPPVGVDSALAQSLLCTLESLETTPIMAEQAPIETGWRLTLRVYTGPPSGWIDKGDIVHDGARIAYLPNGATLGLEDEMVREAVAPILEECRAEGLD